MKRRQNICRDRTPELSIRSPFWFESDRLPEMERETKVK
jgi:hypothetical protein